MASASNGMNRSAVWMMYASTSARGGVWEVLGEQNLMCARNQELCGLDEAIVDGDEVAFFPTVTGG